MCICAVNVLVAPSSLQRRSAQVSPACFLPASKGDGGRPERVDSLFMSTSYPLYDWCFPLHDKHGANSLVEKRRGGGGLKFDACSGSAGSVPRTHLGAFDDAW